MDDILSALAKGLTGGLTGFHTGQMAQLQKKQEEVDLAWKRARLRQGEAAAAMAARENLRDLDADPLLRRQTWDETVKKNADANRAVYEARQAENEMLWEVDAGFYETTRREEIKNIQARTAGTYASTQRTLRGTEHDRRRMEFDQYAHNQRVKRDAEEKDENWLEDEATRDAIHNVAAVFQTAGDDRSAGILLQAQARGDAQVVRQILFDPELQEWTAEDGTVVNTWDEVSRISGDAARMKRFREENLAARSAIELNQAKLNYNESFADFQDSSVEDIATPQYDSEGNFQGFEFGSEGGAALQKIREEARVVRYVHGPDAQEKLRTIGENEANAILMAAIDTKRNIAGTEFDQPFDTVLDTVIDQIKQESREEALTQSRSGEAVSEAWLLETVVGLLPAAKAIATKVGGTKIAGGFGRRVVDRLKNTKMGKRLGEVTADAGKGELGKAALKTPGVRDITGKATAGGKNFKLNPSSLADDTTSATQLPYNSPNITRVQPRIEPDNVLKLTDQSRRIGVQPPDVIPLPGRTGAPLQPTGVPSGAGYNPGGLLDDLAPPYNRPPGGGSIEGIPSLNFLDDIAPSPVGGGFGLPGIAPTPMAPAPIMQGAGQGLTRSGYSPEFLQRMLDAGINPY